MTYQEQLTALVANITPVLKPEYDPVEYAAAMLEEADEDETYFEVRGLHTLTGNPHVFTVQASDIA